MNNPFFTNKMDGRAKINRMLREFNIDPALDERVHRALESLRSYNGDDAHLSLIDQHVVDLTYVIEALTDEPKGTERHQNLKNQARFDILQLAKLAERE